MAFVKSTSISYLFGLKPVAALQRLGEHFGRHVHHHAQARCHIRRELLLHRRLGVYVYIMSSGFESSLLGIDLEVSDL